MGKENTMICVFTTTVNVTYKTQPKASQVTRSIKDYFKITENEFSVKIQTFYLILFRAEITNQPSRKSN